MESEEIWSLRLLREGLFSDFTIEAKDGVFKVHKSFLYCHSGYFRKLLSGQNVEVKEGKVTFDDIEACLLGRAILLCYHQPHLIHSLDFTSKNATWKDDFAEANSNNFVAARLAVKMYALGDRFDMPTLTTKARRTFLFTLRNFPWTEHNDLTAEAANFGQASFAAPDVFMEIVRSVYSTTPSSDRGLRNVFLMILHERLAAGDHFKDSFAFLWQLLDETSEIAADYALHPVTDEFFICDWCRHENRHVQSPCGCPKRDPWCKSEECMEQRRITAFCINCYQRNPFCPQRGDSTDTGDG